MGGRRPGTPGLDSAGPPHAELQRVTRNRRGVGFRCPRRGGEDSQASVNSEVAGFGERCSKRSVHLRGISLLPSLLRRLRGCGAARHRGGRLSEPGWSHFPRPRLLPPDGRPGVWYAQVPYKDRTRIRRESFPRFPRLSDLTRCCVSSPCQRDCQTAPATPTSLGERGLARGFPLECSRLLPSHNLTLKFVLFCFVYVPGGKGLVLWELLTVRPRKEKR